MLIPLLVALGYPAGVIAIWGVTSLILDVDVITETDAGPLLGPSMVLGATLITALWLFRGVRKPGSLVVPILGAVASAYLAMLIVGGIGYWFAHGDAVLLLTFPAHYALSPFIIGAALLSGAAVVLVFATSRRSDV
jgi:hypothetical protein